MIVKIFFYSFIFLLLLELVQWHISSWDRINNSSDLALLQLVAWIVAKYNAIKLL